MSWPTCKPFLCFPHRPLGHSFTFLTYLWIIIVISWPTWRSLLWFLDLLDGHYCGFLTYLLVVVLEVTLQHDLGPQHGTCRNLFLQNKLTPLYCALCSAHLKLFRFILSIFKSGSGSAKKPGSKTQLFFPGSRYWHGPHGPVSSACGFFCWIVHGRWPPTAPTSICMNCCGPNCFALVKIRDQISNLEWPLLKVSYSLSSCLLLSIVIHCWYSFAD